MRQIVVAPQLFVDRLPAPSRSATEGFVVRALQHDSTVPLCDPREVIHPPPRSQGPNTASSTLMLRDVWRPRTQRADVEPGLEHIHDIDVAHNGWRAQRCRNWHFLPDSYPATSPLWTECACGESQDDDRIAVRQSSIALFTNPVHGEFAIWWHVSCSPDLF